MCQIAASNVIYIISNRKKTSDRESEASVGQVVCGSGVQN